MKDSGAARPSDEAPGGVDIWHVVAAKSLTGLGAPTVRQYKGPSRKAMGIACIEAPSKE
jgi:hypothetical protein